MSTAVCVSNAGSNAAPSLSRKRKTPSTDDTYRGSPIFKEPPLASGDTVIDSRHKNCTSWENLMAARRARQNGQAYSYQPPTMARADVVQRFSRIPLGLPLWPLAPPLEPPPLEPNEVYGKLDYVYAVVTSDTLSQGSQTGQTSRDYTNAMNCGISPPNNNPNGVDAGHIVGQQLGGRANISPRFNYDVSNSDGTTSTFRVSFAYWNLFPQNRWLNQGHYARTDDTDPEPRYVANVWRAVDDDLVLQIRAFNGMACLHYEFFYTRPVTPADCPTRPDRLAVYGQLCTTPSDKVVCKAFSVPFTPNPVRFDVNDDYSQVVVIRDMIYQFLGVEE